MKRLIFGLYPAVLLCFLSAPTTASTILGPPDAVIAIDNLLVDGAPVDVTFSNTGFSNTFPTNDPFYNGNSQGAEDAANAIALALTSAGATGLAGDNGQKGGDSVWVPFGPELPDHTVITWAFGNTGAFPAVWGGGAPNVPGHAEQEFVTTGNPPPGSTLGPNFLAVVTPQTPSVPEPASGLLMLAGLAGLFTRKRLGLNRDRTAA
jgi:hypothetical protein